MALGDPVKVIEYNKVGGVWVECGELAFMCDNSILMAQVVACAL